MIHPRPATASAGINLPLPQVSRLGSFNHARPGRDVSGWRRGVLINGGSDGLIFAAALPEPTSGALLMGGLLAVGALARRKQVA